MNTVITGRALIVLLAIHLVAVPTGSRPAAFSDVNDGALTAAPREARADFWDALVGTWEGALPFGDRGADRRRVLVVRSVEKTVDGFTIDARYGIPGRRLERPGTILVVVGDEVTLTVRPSGGAEMRLSLLDGQHLAGPYRGTGRAQSWSIRFEKVQ